MGKPIQAMTNGKGKDLIIQAIPKLIHTKKGEK